MKFEPGVLQKLQKNIWSGNVRELLHVIDRAYVLCGGLNIREEHIVYDGDIFTPGSSSVIIPDVNEAEHIREVLSRHQYNKSSAAEELNMSRATLWRKIKKYGL